MKTLARLLLSSLLLPLSAAFAAEFAPRDVAARQQQQSAAGSRPLTLIDVRPATAFQRSHIPGALNIPLAVLPEKKLPALGEVVVYGDGLGRVLESDAARALAGRPGLTVHTLSGGLAAWESAGLPVAGDRGLTADEVPQLTYQQLQHAAASGVVLVDLRAMSAASEGRAGSPQPAALASTASTSSTDLGALFPQARVLTPSAEAPAAGLRAASASAAAADTAPATAITAQLESIDPARELVVLIDAGDGAAEEVASRLRAAVQRRVVVLTGGDIAIQSRGRSGLERASGGTLEVGSPAATPSTSSSPRQP